MQEKPTEFYRYEAVQYATISIDGEYESPNLPDPKIEVRRYNLLKETPKGYWIGFGDLGDGKLHSYGKWVSKTSVKRYAYPSKKEALNNFIKRNEKRIKILKRQVLFCKIALSKAEILLNKI